ncbi:hypothetical protein KGM_209546 [Danaus plexippus plexippus]|uniref:Uncharacterized protein n=1 Tax=Danaus plexippus plexippus TaxID=278856 RepID=A0A212FIH5_DANPL|nr:uncharacterized protein LOC116767993 [Danaus plexippus plexippus]OWR53527.1 hypothetical protein KGM_209546 [Danaus plexippus plexippus]
MLLMLILLNFLAPFTDATRSKRYLVYPNGGPARTQFIIGLGVPVDLKEASVTVGTVIKFQYDLPTNSSEYTSRIYGFANTVSRDMDGNDDAGDDDKRNSIDTSRDVDKELEVISDTDNDTLVDITFNDTRRKRSLVYSEGGAMNAIDLSDVNTELPLDEAIRRQELIDRNHLEEEEEPQRMNRWDFYKIMEHMMERYGYSGRPCLLRTICEAAEVPFTYENGLLGEIGHILFTPSTTKDSLSHHTDNEYHAAERLGRDVGRNCESLFPECESSILETFTGIGMETLHKFGLY